MTRMGFLSVGLIFLVGEGVLYAIFKNGLIVYIFGWRSLCRGRFTRALSDTIFPLVKLTEE